MYSSFIHMAKRLNKQLNISPLLYGSLGLGKRLSADLHADDIDVLIPKKYLNDEWPELVRLMNQDGYRLVDEHEHEFSNGSVTIAYAELESLAAFAGVDISSIPLLTDGGAEFLLLELPDYLKVYEASSKDGYRKNIKNKQDHQKIAIIKEALRKP